MNIETQSRGFKLTEAISEYVKRRIHLAMASRYDCITHLSVWLSDINGPRGGEDKRCRVQVALAGLPDVVIEDTQTDLYVAIDRAADRARRTVDRRLSRKVTRPRRPRNRQIIDPDKLIDQII